MLRGKRSDSDGDDEGETSGDELSQGGAASEQALRGYSDGVISRNGRSVNVTRSSRGGRVSQGGSASGDGKVLNREMVALLQTLREEVLTLREENQKLRNGSSGQSSFEVVSPVAGSQGGNTGGGGFNLVQGQGSNSQVLVEPVKLVSVLPKLVHLKILRQQCSVVTGFAESIQLSLQCP